MSSEAKQDGAPPVQSNNRSGSQSRRGRGSGRGRAGGKGSIGGIRHKENKDDDGKKPKPEVDETMPSTACESFPKPPSQKVGRARTRKGNHLQQQKHKSVPKSDLSDGGSHHDDVNQRESALLMKQQQEEQAKLQAIRLREKEAREVAVEEAQDMLITILDAAEQRATNRIVLQPECLEMMRKEFESNKKKLKTDLKKCTTFVKKIKSGGLWSMKSSDTQNDLNNLNLSRYVEEVAQAVTDSNIKVGDVPSVVTLCVSMHQRYTEFLPNLMPAMWTIVHNPTPDTMKVRRLYVRLLTEFLMNGLIPTKDIKQFVKLVAEWTGANSGYLVQDANLVVAFSRAAGFEIFGITPTSVQVAMDLIYTEVQKDKIYRERTSENDAESLVSIEVPVILSESLIKKVSELHTKLTIVLANQRISAGDAPETILSHFLGAYATLSNSMVQANRKLHKLEKRCEQDRLLSGSISEAREKGLTEARRLTESLLKTVESLSDCLNQTLPVVEDEDDENNSQSGRGVEVWTKSGEGEGAHDDFGPFDDEESRAFYCDIPDLLTMFPPALLGLSSDDIEKQKATNSNKYGADMLNAAGDEERMDEVAPTSAEQLDAAEEEEARKTTQFSVDESDSTKDTPHFRLMMLLEQELPECHSREKIDEITERFCSTHGSSKNSRKRLLNVLFHVPHTRLDLLPYYSRMAAAVDRIWVDIAATLITDLEQQFHGQAKFKKNLNVDSRMKTARYIGELTKFRVAPPIVALRCLQRCIDDFTGSNVDVACCILEVCGRCLYRMKHTSKRLVALMDTMTRLSKAKNLDDRLQASLKAAYFSVKPPPSGPRRKLKEYRPLESYLRHLLLVRLELTESSVSFVTKQLARLPWSDPSQKCATIVCKLWLKACRKGRYKTIEAVAAVAAKLRAQRAAAEATVRLVDAVIEELKWSLENPNFRDQQRIVTYTRLLGEMHCSGLVASQVILDQLFEFVNVGHEIPESLHEASLSLSKRMAELLPHGDKQSVVSSTSGVIKVIHEDEEIEYTELETKEVVAINAQPVAVSTCSTHDPRVHSTTDPPNSFNRVTLVCCLLEVVAKSIISKNNLPRVSYFLASFQRYLFTKDAIPLDIEFALLDAFDIVDSHWKKMSKGSTIQFRESVESGFPRYTCWLDAHSASIETEQSEYCYDTQKRRRLEAECDDANIVVDGHESGEGNSLQDDDSMLDDDDDDGSFSVSLRESVEGQDDDMENDNETAVEEENEEKDVVTDSEINSDADDDDDDFDEVAYLRQMQEEAFERELRRITMEAMEKGKNASRKQIGDSMISGSQMFRKKEPPKLLEIASDGSVGVTFQLLRKGTKGKVEARELVVPADTNLALVVTKQDDAAARERDEIKQRVLRYEAESAEAEYAGGNVYLEQEKLQVIRNRPLSMEEIDRNFGTSGGNLRQSPVETTRLQNQTAERRSIHRGSPGWGRGRGRGGRANQGGRTLFDK